MKNIFRKTNKWFIKFSYKLLTWYSPLFRKTTTTRYDLYWMGVSPMTAPTGRIFALRYKYRPRQPPEDIQ